MKILSIISAGYEQGGAETATVIYNQCLQLQGHETKIISSDEHPELEHYSDYEFAAIPKSGLKSILYPLFNPSAFRVARKALREFQPDVVILNTMQQVSPSVLYLLGKYPTVHFVHGPEAFTTPLLAWHMQRSNFRNGNYELKGLTTVGKLKYAYLKFVLRPVYRLAMRNVDCFMVLSSYMKQLLLEDGFAGPIQVIRCGIKQTPRPAGRNKDIIIGYAGRLESFKGAEDLINAMPHILKDYPSAKLLIMGTGPRADQFKDCAASLGVSKQIAFMGHVSQRSLRDLYAQMTVFVMPSRWPEAFGKVGIEAMSAGVPVVATDVGGVRDWLHDGKNGYLVSPSTPTMLAEKIIQIISDKKMHTAMSTEALKTAAKYTNDAYTSDILKTIKKVVG